MQGKNESQSSFVYSILHILTTKMMYHNKDETQKRKESHQEYIVYKDIYIYLNDSKEVLYLWKCKVCGVVPYVGKAKIKFCYGFDRYKSKHRALRKDNRQGPQKLFHTHYCLDDHWRLGFCNFWEMRNTCATEGKRNILVT